MSENHTIEAPIRSVVIMEDRAQVTRRGRASLRAGRQVVSVAGATPLVADRTLRCRIRSGGQGSAGAPSGDAPRLVDLRVVRRYLVRPARPEREREIRGAVEQLADEYLAAFDRVASRFRERELLCSGAGGFGQEIADRLAVAPFEAQWTGQVDELFARRARAEEAILADQWAQDDRSERLRALETELALALAPVADFQAALVAEIAAAADGTYEIEWEYQVPCALWRPEYSAELTAGGKAAIVRWRSGGTAWQATGEDWSDVELAFSTARPSLGAELPLLADDVLAARPKTDAEKSTVEVSSRDEVIAKTESAPQARQTDTPPGIDDGGEARTYRVPGRASVPSDGRPHRVEFETWEAEAEVGLFAAPERAAFVFLRSEQQNPSALPLLAGPVALARDGAFVGRASIAYVAPRERFALSWGSEDGLVVLRDVVRKYEETGLRKQRHHRFEITDYLANHTGAPQSLRLLERVPLSEIESVEVQIAEKETSRGFQRSAQGVLSWALTLEAGAEAEVKLVFEVAMPQSVHWNA